MSPLVTNTKLTPRNEQDPLEQSTPQMGPAPRSRELNGDNSSTVFVQFGEDPGNTDPEGQANWQEEDLATLQLRIDELQQKLEALSTVVQRLRAARDVRQHLHDRCFE